MVSNDPRDPSHHERLLVTLEGLLALDAIRSILEKLGAPSRARVAAIMAQLDIDVPSEDGASAQ